MREISSEQIEKVMLVFTTVNCVFTETIYKAIFTCAVLSSVPQEKCYDTLAVITLSVLNFIVWLSFFLRYAVYKYKYSTFSILCLF